MRVKTVVVWLAIMVLAIANGIVRGAVLVPRLGEHAAHVVSTLLLCGLIFLVARLSIRWIGPANGGDALRIGAMWVILTLAFEFIAGHFVFGAPWARLLADYNVLRGRIWPLVPITTLAAPVVALRMRRG